MPRGGYFTRTGQAISPADIRDAQRDTVTAIQQLGGRENGTRVVEIDLTVARTGEALGVGGSSIAIIDPGGADWSFQLEPIANHPDVFRSSYFPAGTVLEFDFTDIRVTNAAAAAGTAPAILVVGRRV